MLSAFFTCYLWWLLAGFLLGWLCNWWLCKCCGHNKSSQTNTHSATQTSATSAAPVSTSTKSNFAAAAPSMAAPVVAAAAAVSPIPSLISDPVINIAAAKLAGISVRGPDDLEVIEGIGPKICALFHAAGHKSFTQMSHLTIQQMSKVLDDAGPRFKLANPETWAQQAGLAANNRWAELKTLQDNLTAGVTMQQDRSEL